jgi:hypothetical protein
MDDYIKSLLTQTLEAHTILNELKGEPDDLEIIKKQVGKIEGVFKVVCKKIKELDYSSDDYVELIKAIKFYLENYDFYNVIEAYKMYDEDSARIRNMRTLVIRALEEKDLIEKIKQVI